MDKYTVERRIGTGSYGAAYLVRLRKNRDVKLVLKKIRIDNISPKERAAAHMEVKLLSELNNPFILTYVDHFMHKNYLCMVTDFCEGGDLYHRLKKAKTYIKEEQVVEWLIQTCLAMQYCHDRNILHRDLKTQNVFLTKEGHVKLGDFGIARVLNAPVEMAMTVIGTPYYMSPEIMESKPYDYKSDIWSLGCVAYEMTSLKHAFDAKDMNGLVMKILRGRVPPIPHHYSSDLRELITKMLSKTPSHRPTIKQILDAPFLRNKITKILQRGQDMEHQRQADCVGVSFKNPALPTPPQTGNSLSPPQLAPLGGAPAVYSSAGALGPRRLSAPGDNVERESLDVQMQRLRERQQERQLRDADSQPNSRRSSAAPERPAVFQPVSHQRSPSFSADEALGGAGSKPPLMPGVQAQIAPSRRGGDEEDDRSARAQRRHSDSRVRSSHSQPRVVGDDGPSSASNSVTSKPLLVKEGDFAAMHAKARDNLEQKAISGRSPRDGGVEAQIQQRRRERRSSSESSERAMSCSPPIGGHSTDSNSSGQAKRDSRRRSEIERHERELLEARRQYFEERKRAAEMQRNQYGYSSGSNVSNAAGRQSSQISPRSDFSARSSDCEDDELKGPVFSANQVQERIHALKELCKKGLGPTLFEKIYIYMKEKSKLPDRNRQDDLAFRSELRERLGEVRMQYVDLIDQLLFCEESL